MELGRPGCPVDRLPDSLRHERGAARCLLGTGANPKVWCDRLEGVMQRVLSRPPSGGGLGLLQRGVALDSDWLIWVNYYNFFTAFNYCFEMPALCERTFSLPWIYLASYLLFRLEILVREFLGVTSLTGRLVYRRLVSSPARMAYYAAVFGRLRLHRRPASVTADWCPRLYGWLVTSPLLGVYVFTDRLPRRRRLMLPPARLAYYAVVVGKLRLHRPATTSPPTGVSTYTDGLLRHRWWASSLSPSTAYVATDWIQIQICIKGIHGFKLISYASGMDQPEHYHRLAAVAADWCPRLYGWVVTPPLLGIIVFTDRPPRPPPTGVLAYTVGWSHHRCWASLSSLTGRLVRRQLVSSPIRLVGYTADVGHLRLHRPAALSAADWCFRLDGWPIMPPMLGVYVFTDRPPCPPPTGVSACTAGLLCRRYWVSTSAPTGRLVRRRLVFLPARQAYYAADAGCLRLHRPAASSVADWCFRLHGRPIMPPMLGVYVFTDRPPRPSPTDVSAYTAGLLCHRLWASTSSPTGHLVRRRLPIMPPMLGVYVFTDRLAFAAVDWCLCLRGWPIMSPLLGVYVFTDRLAFAAADCGVPIFNISTRTSSMRIFTQAMTTRRQEATVPDSMFSCFPTNQRVGGYTNTRLSKFDKLKQSINPGVIFFIFASEQTFYFSNFNYFIDNFGFSA
uniref:cysteine dioxygenase n=2 Tax=Oryza sativa subsp. japonica TaxID=39947 RepID=Q8LMN4_ORYSJ|nr:retrotransposon protein, putative, Ty3-gypsy sub-class [Oryza sativa Japonica Group]AAP52513.1 retrotransposon protein, putative, Ty3-gypsy subclass [Oryza sativa Japonica Group]